MKRKTEIERLYDVADDDEAATLDRLRNTAGITWECRDADGNSHWTNPSHRKTCERCGKRRVA